MLIDASWRSNVTVFDYPAFVRRGHGAFTASLQPVLTAVLRAILQTCLPKSIDALTSAVAVIVRLHPSVVMPAVAALVSDTTFSGHAQADFPRLLLHVLSHAATLADEAGHDVSHLCDFFADLAEVVQGRAPWECLARFAET